MSKETKQSNHVRLNRNDTNQIESYVTILHIFVPRSLAYVYFNVMIYLVVLGCQIRGRGMLQQTTPHTTTRSAHLLVRKITFYVGLVPLCPVLSCIALFTFISLSISFLFIFLIKSHEKISDNNQVVSQYIRKILLLFESAI